MTINAIPFSIVTITKNNLNGLTRTAASINAQSFTGYEWIVIDGASNDGTTEYLADTTAAFVSEPDDGLYDAMNKGTERAKGDYILFLNAGDVLSDPDILSSLAKAAQADAPDFIYGDALETGGFYKKARSHEKFNLGMFTHHQAILYRRNIIGDLRYDTRYKIAADYDFTVRFLKRAKNIHYIPAAICIFETGGISQQNMKLGRQEQFHARSTFGLPILKNIMIYVYQTCAATLKNMAPQLYSRLREG